MPREKYFRGIAARIEPEAPLLCSNLNFRIENICLAGCISYI